VKTILSGGLTSTGEISSRSITIELEHNLYAFTAIFKKLKSSNIISKVIRTKVMSSPLLIPNNEKNVINVNSYLQVKGEIRFEDEKICTLKPKKKTRRGFPTGTSFMQLKSLHINGVRQFQMIKEEDLSVINANLNKKFISLLESNSGNNTLTSEEVLFDKVVNINYEYTHAMIETRFSFANSLWNGNTAYIKIDEHYYWMDQHNWMEEDEIEEKKNICENIDFLNEKWTTPIRIVYRKPTNRNSFKVTFGYKFNHQHNLSSIELSKCKYLTELKSQDVISFANMHILLK